MIQLKKALFSLISLGALAIVFGALPAQAAGFQETTVLVTKDQVVEDSYYVEAEKVVIEGELKGDLVAMASQIEVRGTVEGSIIAIAQKIVVEGRVDGSIRVIAGELHLGSSAMVGSDVNAVTSNLKLEKGSVISRNLYYLATETALNGTVQGVNQDLSLLATPASRSEIFYGFLINFLSLGLFGVLLYTLQSQKITDALWQRARDRFLPNFLMGLGLFLGMLILSPVLILTGVGSWVGFALLAMLVLLSVISLVDAAYFLGRLIVRRAHHPRFTIAIFLFGLLLMLALSNLVFLIVIPAVIFVTCLAIRLQDIYYFLRGEGQG